MSAMGSAAERFVGCVEDDERVRDAFCDDAPKHPIAVPLAVGSWGCFVVQAGVAVLEGDTLATPGSALAAIYGLAARHQLQPLYPRAVEAECEALRAAPGIDDGTLEDLTHLPFITIDEEHSQDLDQALFIAAEGAGHQVWYAIADPAWAIRPGTALFADALARGATYYLPGLSIPMLPRPLSEGVISLNPGRDRRAMVFSILLDATGEVTTTRIQRALVRSRVKTNYDAVQAFFDGTSAVPGGDPEVAESLRQLRAVGERRLARAAARDVVQVRRTEVSVNLADDVGLRFVALADLRNDVERYNEQISLLANVEGARFLHRHDREDDHVQPIYRVHGAPEPARLASLVRQIGALCRIHELDDTPWRWRPKAQSLAAYLSGLPSSGPQVRLARVIQRQAMLVGGRSGFDGVPGSHYGVGAEIYARFTAPMREVVGVFVHKEAWEKLAGQPAALPPGVPDDEALRTQVVAAANRARHIQRSLDREANRLVLDQLLGDDLARAGMARSVHHGTVMGLTRRKVHVQLDDPPIDLKVYHRHLAEQLGGPPRLAPNGVTLLRRDGQTFCAVGDEVRVRVRGRDRQRDRWSLELLP